MTKTVPVPSGVAPATLKQQILDAQITAKESLLSQIKALGVDALYDRAEVNIIITIPATSEKSLDEIKVELQKIQDTFNVANKDNNHISFAGVSVTSSDGECGVRKMKGRSPAKDGGRRRGSPKRY